MRAHAELRVVFLVLLRSFSLSQLSVRAFNLITTFLASIGFQHVKRNKKINSAFLLDKPGLI